MKIINKTPHAVTLCRDDEVSVFPSEGSWRCAEKSTLMRTIDGIPIYKLSYDRIDLPPEEEGVYYIVSNVVQMAYPERRDLLIPLDLVRDEKGAIIGCRSFGYAYLRGDR